MTKEEVKKLFRNGDRKKITIALRDYFEKQRYGHRPAIVNKDIISVAQEIFNT